MYRYFLFAPLLLIACATPRQQCITAATKDLQVINTLIAETEANLSRGYAIETEYRTTTSLNFCAGDLDPFLFCTTSETVPHGRPVAIYPSAERRILQSLVKQRAILTRRSAAEIKICAAKYPAT